MTHILVVRKGRASLLSQCQRYFSAECSVQNIYCFTVQDMKTIQNMTTAAILKNTELFLYKTLS